MWQLRCIATWGRTTYPFVCYSIFTADTLRYAVTLIYDLVTFTFDLWPLTLRMCNVWCDEMKLCCKYQRMGVARIFAAGAHYTCRRSQCWKCEKKNWQCEPLYKYWLVPRSTLKNYAQKFCNVAHGRRPEGNITQLRGIIFQCWSRLTVNICFVISRKTGNNYRIPHSALPAYWNW